MSCRCSTATSPRRSTGKIGLRLVDPGNLVQANGSTALAVITQVQPITVIFTLSEDSLGPVVAQLREGTRLAVDVFDRTAQTRLASGQLLALDNQIDTTTGTVKVRAIFDNKDDALFPNQFVNTRLLVNTVHGATLVDAAAVQQNGQSAYVYVIQNNVAHLRPVTVGVTDSGKTQVTRHQSGRRAGRQQLRQAAGQRPRHRGRKARRHRGGNGGHSRQ